MVRFYKRKTTRGQYGVHNLNAAIEEVKAGRISKNKAQALYGVPRKTLNRHLKGLVEKPGNLGRFSSVLGDQFEEVLVEHALTLQQRMFGMTTSDIRKLAFDIAEAMKMPHPFKNQKAGKDWLRSFMRRHTELSIRSPEPTSICRAVGFNQPSVKRFFDALKAELTKARFDATRIYNMDETGLTVVHCPQKVLAKRGQKQIGKVVSGEKGQTVTAICACSASGNYVPPALIYKRKRMNTVLLNGSPAGTVGYTSENGWTNNELFVKWLEHFSKFVKPSKDEPVILILDGHGSHKTLSAIEFAREHGIVMISLPPHTTHELQPLDLTFFGPLKAYYNSECDKWMVNHPGQRISQFDLAALFGAAYVRTATVEKAVNGFNAPGIWPFNPDKINPERFIAAAVTEEPHSTRPTIPTSASSATSNNEPNVQLGPIAVAYSSSATDSAVIPGPTETGTSSTMDAGAIETGSSSATHDFGASHLQMDSFTKYRDVIQRISPLPKCSATRQRKRKIEGAEVLTASPYKNMLVDKLASQKSHGKAKSLHSEHVTQNCRPTSKQKRKNIDKTSKSSKGKKKMTCRADKPRGRKPNTSKCAEKATNKKLRKTNKTVRPTAEQNSCLICAEVFADSKPGEKWIQCQKCRGWCHEECSEGETSRGFICDFCRPT